MENTVVKTTGKVTSNSSKDVFEAMQGLISEIKELVMLNHKYQFNSNITDLDRICDGHIARLGVRDRKRIKRYINSAYYRKSLFAYNRLLRFLCKKILGIHENFDVNIKITEPKHEEIQAKRQAWLKLRAESDKALAEYKEEKGNYYKEGRIK